MDYNSKRLRWCFHSCLPRTELWSYSGLQTHQNWTDEVFPIIQVRKLWLCVISNRDTSFLSVYKQAMWTPFDQITREECLVAITQMDKEEFNPITTGTDSKTPINLPYQLADLHLKSIHYLLTWYSFTPIFISYKLHIKSAIGSKISGLSFKKESMFQREQVWHANASLVPRKIGRVSSHLSHSSFLALLSVSHLHISLPS